MDIRDSIRKNKDDINGIFLHNYPDFVFKSIDILEAGKIPVFVFHKVDFGSFYKTLSYLSENNYKTVDADNLYKIICGEKKVEEKTIALTFDDGLASLWTIAYPLLKKFGFVGISFLIPSYIKNGDKNGSNLEDVWLEKTSLQELVNREKQFPLCTWSEISEMHTSRVIDFQSHSFYHCSIYVGSKLIDFINPSLKPSFFQSPLNPLVMLDGKQSIAQEDDLGLPIYKWDANLSARVRYIENEKVSDSCMEFVRNNGGVDFFKNAGWRNKLIQHWENVSSKYEKSKKFQSAEERIADIRKELVDSKTEIENKLGKEVKHLCYPWYKGSENSVSVSKEVGYKSNYWGLIQGKSINKVGDNPFYIKRINERYIFSLPGKSRKPFYKIVGKKILPVKRIKN